MKVVLYQPARIALARDSLYGLSVGDAYGAQHFTRPELRTPPWPWTDDTQMAAVTHAHPEGVAGAVAVAVAASAAAHARLDGSRPDLLAAALQHTDPGSVVSRLLRRARRIRGARQAAAVLGTGERVTAQDTVPFAIWVAARHLDDFAAAVEACCDAGGDVDTTAAIVGGIVAAYAPAVPDGWLRNREPLP